MSTFNPQAFLSVSVDAAFDTKIIPVPEGEYTGILRKITPRQLQDGRVVLDLSWVIDDATVREATGSAEPQARQTLWLDITPEGNLDCGRGKNVGLGRLRDALNQNAAGQDWSPDMLIGAPAHVKVSHRVNGQTGDIFADVTATTSL